MIKTLQAMLMMAGFHKIVKGYNKNYELAMDLAIKFSEKLDLLLMSKNPFRYSPTHPIEDLLDEGMIKFILKHIKDITGYLMNDLLILLTLGELLLYLENRLDKESSFYADIREQYGFTEEVIKRLIRIYEYLEGEGIGTEGQEEEEIIAWLEKQKKEFKYLPDIHLLYFEVSEPYTDFEN